MDVGTARGLEKATGTLLNTGVRLMEFNAQNKIAQEQNEREQIRFQNEQKRAAEEEADNERWIPASAVARNIHSMPKVKENYLKAIEAGGFEYKTDSTGEVYIQKKAIKHLGQLQRTNLEFSKTILDSTYADTDAQLSALVQQKQALMEGGKPDPKKMQEIDQQIMQKKGAISELLGATSAYQKHMAEKEKADEFAGTSGVVYSKKTGKPSYISPKVASGGGAKPVTVQQAITQLKAFANNNYQTDSSGDKDGRLKVQALISRLENGELKPEQIKYPTEIEGGRLVHKKKGVDVAQHRKWAAEAIAAGASKEKVKKDFKALTGQDY